MKKRKFLLETDWIFQGIIDSELKLYVLLNFIQKINKSLLKIHLYPAFIEIAIHLGNIQMMTTKNKIISLDKKYLKSDDEILIGDINLKDIPVLAEEEIEEYNRILQISQSHLSDYFKFIKILWGIVYDSIIIDEVKNSENIGKNKGYIHYKIDDNEYTWKYTIRKNKKFKDYTKMCTRVMDSTIIMESDLPVFEIFSKSDYPINETFLPITKKKIMAYIDQSKK